MDYYGTEDVPEVGTDFLISFLIAVSILVVFIVGFLLFKKLVAPK